MRSTQSDSIETMPYFVEEELTGSTSLKKEKRKTWRVFRNEVDIHPSIRPDPIDRATTAEKKTKKIFLILALFDSKKLPRKSGSSKQSKNWHLLFAPNIMSVNCELQNNGHNFISLQQVWPRSNIVL